MLEKNECADFHRPISVPIVVQDIRMAQNFEEIFDASSAHKMCVLIANYKRYLCVCAFVRARAHPYVCVCVCLCVFVCELLLL